MANEALNEEKKCSTELSEDCEYGESIESHYSLRDTVQDEKHPEIVVAYCWSLDGIAPLHKALKKVAKKANAEYLKLVKEQEAARGKGLEDKSEIERLRNTLKSEIE